MENDIFKCKCGKILKQKKGTGWSNLMVHIRTQHETTPSGPQNTLDFMQCKKSQTIHDWIEWICMELRPFSFVESEYVKKNVKLEAISKNTLQKYMHLLTKKVEQEIIKAMPEKIALIVDGWTSGSTHYLGVMASFCDMDQNVEVPLLAFSPLIDETSQSAAQQYVFLEMTLSQYGKSMEDNVVALIADNCETNKALADICNVPLVGCHSHRLALAVKEYLTNKDELIQKVNTLMGKLKAPKTAAELRNFTNLKPVQYCVTRWLSVMQMLKRFTEIKDTIRKIPAVIDFLLSPKEELEIEQLVKILEPMKSVTIALQRSDMDMDSARTLFDELLKTVENFDRNKKYIHNNCAIAKNNSFENAIVKLQSGDECALNVNENLACKKLRRTSDIECEFPQTDDFAGNVLAKKKKDTKQMKYIPCSFILPTSNHLERFFSAAGFASNDYRKSTLPMNLEEQLFLRFNKKHWDLNLVNQIVSASE